MRRRILLLSIAMFVAGVVSLGSARSLPEALVTTLGPLTLILVVWRRGLDDELSVGLIVILLDIAAVILGMSIRAGLAFAVLLPSVAVATMSSLARSRLWLALATSAWISTVTGAWLWLTVSPAASEMPLLVPLPSMAGITTAGALGLALLWRSRQLQDRAMTAARDAATTSAAAAEELARTSETLRTLLDASPVAIQAFGPDRNVLVWNAGSERLFGWTAAEVIGKPQPPEMTPREELASSAERIKRTFAGEIVRGDRVHRRSKDGRDLLIEIHAAAMHDSDGNAIGLVGALLDVTERERIEAERRAAAEREYELESRLRQAAKMEAVGQLAGGIAHDFNNMLTAIRGFAELARTGLTAADSSAKDDLEQIIGTSDRAARLTQQLLTFARRSVVDPHVLDPSEVLGTVVPMIGRLVGDKIQIEIKPRSEAGYIKVDPIQLEQALVNLTVNARDAMPDGGRLTIEIDRTDVDAAFVALHPELLPGPCVIIRVCDTGVGMDATTRDRMFEPFFTTKETGKGTGMGLATVFGIMSMCGGAIDVASQPGAGTSVALYFPRVEREDAESVQTR